MSGRLGPGVPAVVAAGPRRRRHLHVRDDSTPRRAATRRRSPSTKPGTRTTARAGPGRGNIAFTVPADNAKVTFTYVAATHVLTVLAGHGHDNNIEWDGLRHDSRSDVYRTPGGAVQAGTPVTLRFRTFHDDVTSVRARFYSLRLGGQQIVPMSIAAAGVPCYQPGLESETCDFWQLTMPRSIADQPDNLWYRFIVSDGTSTAYYADDTAGARRWPWRADRRGRSTRAGR